MGDPMKPYSGDTTGSVVSRRTIFSIAVAVLIVVASFGIGMYAAGGSGTAEAPTNSGVEYESLYNDTKDSVVGVKVIGSDGGSGGGTGFVYDADGHIVTNAHVVQDADTVYVQFSNGESAEATIIGTDADSDLAVLEPESVPAGVTALEMADRNPIRGQSVMIVGSPFAFEQSVSHGIVSGEGRELRRANGFVIPDIIQTDAPVNPGNSGSPVVDENGTAVGVVTAKQGDNIGFAISAEVTNEIVPQLIESGSVNHSYVGVRTVSNDPVIADANNLTATNGMGVVEVVEGSPADGVLEASEERTATSSGGVEVSAIGDVIVGIDGTEVRSSEDLGAYLMKHTEPGDTVTLTVLRDGERVDVELTLGERPEE